MLTAAVYANCGPTAGLGHFRRSLTLAAALRAAGANVVVYFPDPDCRAMAAHEGWCVAPAKTALAVPRANIFCGDDYRILWEESRTLLERHDVTLLFDDLGRNPVSANVALNHNIYGDSVDYSKYSLDFVLGGLKYTMALQQLMQLRDQQPQNHVLVSFGGTDDGRYGLPLAEEILKRTTANVTVLLSPLLPVSPEIATRAMSLGSRVSLMHGGAMSDLLRPAKIYVGAAGATVLEALSAGRGVVACAIADNQLINIDALRRMGFSAFDVPDFPAMADAVRDVLIGGETTVVEQLDGRGPQRVADALIHCCLDRAAV